MIAAVPDFVYRIQPGRSGPWRVTRCFPQVAHDIFDLHHVRAILKLWKPDWEPPEVLLYHKQTLFMSTVGEEMRTHERMLDLVHGRVLVTGLGLGIAPVQMLATGRVDAVTIIEKSRAVIRLVAPHLPRDRRLEVLRGDAFSSKLAGHWDWAWHDIWPFRTLANLPEMIKIVRHWRDRVDRQLCWGIDEAEADTERQIRLANTKERRELLIKALDCCRLVRKEVWQET